MAGQTPSTGTPTSCQDPGAGERERAHRPFGPSRALYGYGPQSADALF
jgi:hypothetical protein